MAQLAVPAAPSPRSPHLPPPLSQERIEKILAAGANVILTTKGIDDMALKYFVEAGAIAVRRVKKEDLRRIAKVRNSALPQFGPQFGPQFCSHSAQFSDASPFTPLSSPAAR